MVAIVYASIRPSAAWAVRGLLFSFAYVLLMLVMVAGYGADAKERVALVIGNSKYQHSTPLKNPENDARLIASKLRKIGFDVIERVNLSKADFDDALIEFSKAASNLDTGTGRESIALFFYAGHGVQVKDINYLIPIDAQIEGEAEIRIRSVSMNNVLATLDDSGAGVSMIILDACRDNPFPAATRSGKRGLAKIEEIEGSVIAYATSPGQVAFDGIGENSPYSEALARMMETTDLTIEEMFRKINKQVKDATSGTQLPWLSLSLSEEIYLAGRAPSTELSYQETEPTQTKGGLEESTGTETAQLLWDRALEKDTVEAYDEVYRKFPNSEEGKRAFILKKLRTDEKSWEAATQANTAGSYNMYMLKHPDGTYVAIAKQRLAALETDAVGTQGGQDQIRGSVPAGDLQEFSGFDAYAFDYKQLPDISFDDCKQACLSDRTCKALTYNRAHALCFLKDGAQYLVPTTDTEALVAGHLVERLTKIGVRALQMTVIDGYDYDEKKTDSFFECLLQCENDPRCRAISWVKSKKWCSLKSKAGRVSFSRKVDSGVK